MPSPSQDPRTSPNSMRESGASAPPPAAQGSGNQETAALGPAAQPISAAGNRAPAPPTDLSAESEGRRTLSTAFVRIGPDGLLTVKRDDGSTLILRDVVMRRKKYCGRHALGDQAGAEYCGGYAEIATARPGGAEARPAPDLAAPNPMGASANQEK